MACTHPVVCVMAIALALATGAAGTSTAIPGHRMVMVWADLSANSTANDAYASYLKQVRRVRVCGRVWWGVGGEERRTGTAAACSVLNRVLCGVLHLMCVLPHAGMVSQIRAACLRFHGVHECKGTRTCSAVKTRTLITRAGKH